MKKSKKNKKMLWTKCRSSYILSTFLFVLVTCLSRVRADEPKGFVTPRVNQLSNENSFTSGATVGEMIMLKEELKFLQSELIEVLEKYETLKEKDENLNLHIVNKMMSVEDVGSEENLSVSRSALKVVSEISRKQSAKTILFCDFLNEKIKDVKMDELDKFELISNLKSLRSSSEKVVDFLDGSLHKAKTDSCDVLSVDDKLQIVILAKGAKDGLFVGSNLTIGEDIELEVVSIRPYVAATMLLKGKISDIAPGMKACRKAITRTKNKETGI